VAGRIGAVTHKGLGELIRENYSKRIAVLAAIPMALVDIISYIVEYTGMVISILFCLAWVASAFLTARRGIQITPFYFSISAGFFFLLAANVGAVIMPFMLFYQASATAEKSITAKSLWAVRLETGIGAIVSELIMVAILISAIGVKTSSMNFAVPRVLSQGLASVAGSFAPYVFGIGLIAASFIALIVISLGSSWGVVEALG
jgi:Mn2+/Fe2+ NRAMP family transporter